MECQAFRKWLWRGVPRALPDGTEAGPTSRRPRAGEARTDPPKWEGGCVAPKPFLLTCFKGLRAVHQVAPRKPLCPHVQPAASGEKNLLVGKAELSLPRAPADHQPGAGWCVAAGLWSRRVRSCAAAAAGARRENGRPPASTARPGGRGRTSRHAKWRGAAPQLCGAAPAAPGAGLGGRRSQLCRVSRAEVRPVRALPEPRPLPVPVSLLGEEGEDSEHPQAESVMCLGVLPDQPTPPCSLMLPLPHHS